MLPSTSSSQAVAATRGGGNTEETGGSNKMEGNKADQTDGANKATENEGSLVETDKPIGVLYLALLSDENERNQAKDGLATDDQNIVKETAKKTCTTYEKWSKRLCMALLLEKACILADPCVPRVVMVMLLCSWIRISVLHSLTWQGWSMDVISAKLCF